MDGNKQPKLRWTITEIMSARSAIVRRDGGARRRRVGSAHGVRAAGERRAARRTTATAGTAAASVACAPGGRHGRGGHASMAAEWWWWWCATQVKRMATTLGNCVCVVGIRGGWLAFVRGCLLLLTPGPALGHAPCPSPILCARRENTTHECSISAHFI